MVRIITQVLIGLMLFFGVITLLPKACIEFKARRPARGLLYALLGLLALYFSSMAFVYAYLHI
jgi:hypothetical protein